MSKKKNKINGYILAGGKSSRMGADKGLLLLNGKPIIQYVIEQLQPAVNEVVIVSGNAEYKRFGLEVIGDLVKDIGPAGGIYSALRHTHSGKIFIVSCDMPFISTPAIKYIIQTSIQSQITLLFHHEKIEPLFGVYSTACLSQWQELIKQGIFKLQDMITRFDLLKLYISDNKLFNDLLFVNINDKNDLVKAFKQV